MSELKFKNKYRIPSNRLKNYDYSNNAAYFITICTQNREHFFGKIKNGEMHLNELGENATRFWLDIPKHFPFIELGNFVVMPNHTHGILIIDKTPINTNNGCGITENVVGNECYIRNGTVGRDGGDGAVGRDGGDGAVGRDDGDGAVGRDDGDGAVGRDDGDGAVGRDDGDVDTPNLGVSTAYPSPPSPSHVSSNTHISTKHIETEKPKNGGKNEQWKPGTIGVIINQYKRIVTINNRKINPKFKWQSNYHDHIIRNSFSFENIQNYIEKNPSKWNEDKFY